MKRYIVLALALCVSVVLFSCGVFKTTTVVAPKTINLALVGNVQPNKFVNLDYGIRLNVNDARANTRVLKQYDVSATSLPQVRVSPDIYSFVSESSRRYMRTLGFNLDADIATDYMMTLTIHEYNVSYLTGVGWAAVVELGVEVYDNNRTLVYPNVMAVGRANKQGYASDFNIATEVINKAYASALADIDWDRIAFFLKKASSPKLEANKQVTGEGNTALESTVIRWYIDSSPKGADVSIRVVSSTSEVYNTNQNYVGTTPYETTETFDIKGLTYNNSGNVQIEVTCEKAGYITQKRRFNLRQAIDQKEISTKFTLLREE
ncbi:MAG: hypothetical protein IKY56_01845 [Alistipes sp.]|nr:hypothetical protein [Alistipes sp.]